jgi:predicted phage-related endonuclease
MLDPQATKDWLQARCGALGASQVGEAIARLKRSGDRTARASDLMYEIAAERITGVPAKTHNALRWGADHEDEARQAYRFLTNAQVHQVGFIVHPTIARSGCSPDALVGEDGGLEIKAPTSATHLRRLIEDVVPDEHLMQMAWGMACTGRRFWDFASYDPRFPPGLQLFVKRLERDDQAIAQMEAEVIEFLAEVNAKLAAIVERYGELEPAA